MKYSLLIIPFCLFSHFLDGFSATAEVRAGDFYPSSKTFRKIYQNGGVEYEAEIALQLAPWSIWINGNSFEKEGHSLGLQDKTTLEVHPISAGINYQLRFFPGIYPYIGTGISRTQVKTHDESRFIKNRMVKNPLGAVFKSGVLLYLPCRFFLDGFIDYYYTPLKTHHISTNVGGLHAGLGLGIYF